MRLASAFRVLALGAVLAPALPSTASAPEPRKLSAEQIIARNVAARGGLEAWRKVDTMLWMGHIESVRATVPMLQFMLAVQRPNKTHFEINAMGDRTIRVFDGTQGWKLRPAHGRPDVQPFSDAELRFERSGPGLEGVLMGYEGKAGAVEVKGIDEIDKRKTYHLILRTDSGESQQVWIDAKTFLEARYDRPAPAVGGGAGRTVSVVFRDYKDVEGLKFPMTIETGVGAGNTPDRMVIEKVLLNPTLDAQTFSEPGVPRKNVRTARDRSPFPPHRPPGPAAGYPPAWALKPPPAPPATPAPANPAPQSAGQSDSPPTPSQDPAATPR
jgi:hypothetical protein